MNSTLRTPPGFIVLGALLLCLAACGCDGASSAPPDPAPDFTLTDSNQASPTFGEDRQLSEVSGRVIVMHFALYT